MIKKTISIYLLASGGIYLAQSFFFATYQLFLASHGLSYLEMNLVNFTFMISCFILEIPTGAYADVFGRRRSIVIGCLTLSLSFFIYFLAGSFWFFVLAEIIGAVGYTFISGALEAWMVDSLRQANFSGRLEKIFRQENLAKLIGLMIGSLAGAALASYSLALPWLASSLALLILSGIIYRILPRNGSKAKTLPFSFKVLRNVARDSLNYGYRHRPIFYLIGFNACLCLAFQAFNMQWPLVFTSYGLSVTELGLIFNGIALTNYLGSCFSLKLLKLFRNEKQAVIMSQLITALGMFLASLMFGYYFVLSGFMLHEIGRGVFRPLKQSYLNRHIEGDTRATILSFDSMVGQLGAGLGLIMSGLLADSFSISLAWLVSALVVLLAVITFSFLKNGE